MTSKAYYEAVAEAFREEGVDTMFALLGNANMHWASAMKRLGVKAVYTRHEHCACAMAMGYHSATGNVGIATVTCGPGFTQVMTALGCAVESRVPMVLFAGDAPIGRRWHIHRLDYGPLARGVGAHFIAAHSPQRMLDDVQEAFYVARHERRPVVLTIPSDLQKLAAPEAAVYTPSSTVIPHHGPMPPYPGDVRGAVERLLRARRPVILAGRGARNAATVEALTHLADRIGAILATTLPARGIFDHHPFSIGICGGFASATGQKVLHDADLVLAVGASLGQFTTDDGNMFPHACVIQIDENPVGLKQGRRAADIYIRADAGLGVDAILASLGPDAQTASVVRTDALAREIADTAAPPPAAGEEIAGELDPRQVVAALDASVPKDWDLVGGSGHCAYFAAQMFGRQAGRYHSMREFGAIGNGLSLLAGVASARTDGRIMLLDGDGSFIMHVQELDTIARHDLKCLMCILNDGTYSAEIHKMWKEGLDESGALFGRPDFAAMARAFGLRGATVTRTAQLPGLIREYAENPGAMVIDIHVTNRIASPRMQKQTAHLPPH